MLEASCTQLLKYEQVVERDTGRERNGITAVAARSWPCLGEATSGRQRTWRIAVLDRFLLDAKSIVLRSSSRWNSLHKPDSIRNK